MAKKSATKKEKFQEPKLKIGSLVCVRTHNSFADNWTNITTNIPYISTTNVSPWVTTPNASPYTGGETITTPTIYPNYPTVGSNEPEWTVRDDLDSYVHYSTECTDIVEKINSSKEEMDGLGKLCDGCLNKSFGQGGNAGDNTPGMTIWNGPPTGGSSSPRWKITNNSNSTIKVNRPTKTVSAGTNTVAVNMSTKFEFDFHAKGYRKIEDFFLSIPTSVKQEEEFTKEEIEAFNKEGNVFLQWGKPFKGIVVDMFSPDLRTENGEEVLLGVNKFPKMYKVLIGEKDCLWFTESDVYIMTNKEQQ